MIISRQKKNEAKGEVGEISNDDNFFDTDFRRVLTGMDFKFITVTVEQIHRLALQEQNKEDLI
jgi:hypothetical protein